MRLVSIVNEQTPSFWDIEFFIIKHQCDCIFGLQAQLPYLFASGQCGPVSCIIYAQVGLYEFGYFQRRPLAGLPSVDCFHIFYAEVDRDPDDWQIAFQCVLVFEGDGCSTFADLCMGRSGKDCSCYQQE